MSANLGSGQWGAGGAAHPLRETAQVDGLADDRIDELVQADAKQAIESLGAEFGADKLDFDAPETFPGPIAEAAYWSDASVLGIQGPVGSGKTTTLLKSRLRRAMCAPRSVIDGRRRYKLTVTRANYRQLWATTIPDFLKVFPKQLGDWAGGKGGPVTFVMLFDDGHAVEPPEGHVGEWHNDILFTVEFMAYGDDVEASIRGLQTTDFWLHEMDTNPVEVISNGITRIRRYPGQEHYRGYPPEMCAYGQLCGDFNAPEPDNWAVGLFHEEEKRTDLLAQMNLSLPAGTPPITIDFFRQPGFGEPDCENMHNLALGYYETQIATLTLMGQSDRIDRLVRNLVVHTRAGEPVFQREFSRRLHVSDKPLKPWPGVPLMIGLDQGLKGAAVVGQILTEGTGKWQKVFWQILAELHFPNERLMAKVFGERLRDMLDDRFRGLQVAGGWADMAGEHASSQAADENDTWNRLVSRAAEFRIRPQKIGTNRIQPRLEAVRAALEAPTSAGRVGLLIDPSCKFLIAGFEARYVWTEEITPKGDKHKVPNKALTEANVMDALQYLLLSHVRADGTTERNTPEQKGLIGHNGGPRLSGDEGGLKTGFDVLNPRGE